MCLYRKHHCPIHHFPSTLGPGPSQWYESANATDYSDTFQAPPKGARRGLKLPLVITHSDLNKQTSKVETEQGSAYKQFADTKPAKVGSLIPLCFTYHPTFSFPPSPHPLIYHLTPPSRPSPLPLCSPADAQRSMSSQLLHFPMRPAIRRSFNSLGLPICHALNMADTSSPPCAWTTRLVSTTGLPAQSTSEGGQAASPSTQVGSQ